MATLELATLLATTAALEAVTGDLTESHRGPQRLPASCIARVGPPISPSPTRWRHLLPHLVVGLDHRPSVRRRSGAESETVQPGGFTEIDGRHRTEGMTRWTISLRWNTSRHPVESDVSPPRESAISDICDEYLLTHQNRPADLAGAIDQWAETARLLAILDYSAPPEETHE